MLPDHFSAVPDALGTGKNSVPYLVGQIPAFLGGEGCQVFSLSYRFFKYLHTTCFKREVFDAYSSSMPLVLEMEF